MITKKWNKFQIQSCFSSHMLVLLAQLCTLPLSLSPRLSLFAIKLLEWVFSLAEVSLCNQAAVDKRCAAEDVDLGRLICLCACSCKKVLLKQNYWAQYSGNYCGRKSHTFLSVNLKFQSKMLSEWQTCRLFSLPQTQNNSYTLQVVCFVIAGTKINFHQSYI